MGVCRPAPVLHATENAEGRDSELRGVGGPLTVAPPRPPHPVIGALLDVGVDVVLDLPGFGANLHDHPMSSVVYSAGLSMPPGRHNHGEACGLVRSDAASDVLDLQILFVSCPYHNPMMLGAEVGYSIAFSVMGPHSRGTVQLASADPGAAPSWTRATTPRNGTCR
jgi:hypothetical protein